MAELFEVRNLFLDHSWNYGLDLPVEKREALSRGDTSGLIVHSLLVNVCQLLGYLIATHRSSSAMWLYFEDQTEGEVMQACIISEVLRRSPHTLDPVTTMQVYSLFARYYGTKGDTATFAQLFDQLGNIVRGTLADLGLDDTLPLLHVPQLATSSSLPRASAQEARSAFSGVMWLEFGVCLVLKLPPMLDLSIWATHQTDTETNFIRAKSALVLYDTRQLVADWGRWPVGHPASTLWSMRYSNLIEDIYAHLKVINTSVLEEAFIHETQVLTLKSCVLVALAALVELYALFAPYQPDSRRRHSETVQQIAAITGMFALRDFQYLDASLALCWSIALRPICADHPSAAGEDFSHVHSHGILQSGLNIIREAHERLSRASPYVFEV
ncbi:hypothetical protein DFH09DRAFT_1310907 [Mycena vulgaris]|nr:hypothetical protein DFH09DRAFT_1310907 [Mycena vulgaris]